MLTIYASAGSVQRLEYVADHLFRNLLGTEFQITSDKDFYLKQTGACIRYSDSDCNHGIRIFPHGLLSETGVRPVIDLQEGQWNDLFCFFYTGQGDIPFDLFAASFYLLSLYEEYFPEKVDQHGRFDHREALLFQKGLLETPILDRWAYRLKEMLEATGCPAAGFQLRKYRFVSTYDIDHPFIYRYKGFIKTTGGLLRDLLKQNFKGIKERIQVVCRQQEDPYLTAIRMIHSLQAAQDRPYYLFVLLGARGKWGRTTVYSPKAYYRYLKTVSLATIGLHPSYKTFKALKILQREKTGLEKITGFPPVVSRQHFLRMQVPETFQDLHQAGFREDFTLAFAQAPGFRSGTAVPHYFYDLSKNEPTALLLRPTILMDSTLIFNQKLSPEAALKKIKSLIDACWQSGGDYLSIWHNSNLAGTPEENPWMDVFIESYCYAIFRENC